MGRREVGGREVGGREGGREVGGREEGGRKEGKKEGGRERGRDSEKGISTWSTCVVHREPFLLLMSYLYIVCVQGVHCPTASFGVSGLTCELSSPWSCVTSSIVFLYLFPHCDVLSRTC